MKICFTGDLFLGGDLLKKSMKNTINVKEFINADKRVINLEQPISDTNLIEDKCTLYTGSYATDQLNELKISAVNLAHNHIQDKSLSGINETIAHLENASIGTFGAGKDIEMARKPFVLSDELCVLGYCDYGKSYLNQISVASKNIPGVNPLRYENILKDLDNIDEGKNVVLYFHWGEEHVWLPKYDDIELAKKLLDHEKVVLIVGMHCHRAQGFIEHNNKRAYMSLGNFLFPNFYINPPTQIYYPDSKAYVSSVTRQYHSVNKLTYKKWRLVNRVSILLTYDTRTKSVSHTYSHQHDDTAKLVNLSKINQIIMDSCIQLLSYIYKLPKFIYKPLEKIINTVQLMLWRAGIYLFTLKQIGFIPFLTKVIKKLAR